MSQLTREDLMSLEEYAAKRADFRKKIIAHKKNRILLVGPNASVHFEDRFLIQYQVQEMLRAERVFEAEGIKEELDAYNPLIPDGSNWKATFMIEYADEAERSERLRELIGIEKTVWVQIDGCDKVNPICNEDLDRETAEKTSSVDFLRFELTPEMVEKAKAGASISVGIDHPKYAYAVEPVIDSMRESLVADLS